MRMRHTKKKKEKEKKERKSPFLGIFLPEYSSNDRVTRMKTDDIVYRIKNMPPVKDDQS